MKWNWNKMKQKWKWKKYIENENENGNYKGSGNGNVSKTEMLHNLIQIASAPYTYKMLPSDPDYNVEEGCLHFFQFRNTFFLKVFKDLYI